MKITPIHRMANMLNSKSNYQKQKKSWRKRGRKRNSKLFHFSKLRFLVSLDTKPQHLWPPKIVYVNYLTRLNLKQYAL